MGSCYSRKASKSRAYSSAATRMATARHDEAASRLARPTPYSRNNPASKKLSTAIPKLEPECKAQTSKLSSIPRPSKVVHSNDEVDSNSNLSPDSHLINNNNNLQSNLKTMSGKTSRSKSMSPQSDKTKIPSKLTAHISGLPRPQVVHTIHKSSSTDSFHEQEAQTKNNNLSPQDNEEWDSGLGSSIIEKPSSKPDDAETLKDADESLEGSPVVSKNSNSVSKHILKFENIASIKADEIAKMNSSTPSLPKQHSYSPTYRSVFNYSKSTESYKKTFNDSSNNGSTPLTYGSYRNFLSYRKSLSANSSFSYWQNIDDKPDTKEIKSNKPSKLPASVNKFSSASNCSTPSKSPKDQRKLKSSQQGSPESGVLSPVAELENRQFLIDDEISDQPGLISFQRNTLKDSVSELQALKAAANSEVFSSCSSLCSDDLMLDYEKSSALDLDETITSGSSPSHQKLKDEKRHSVNGDITADCPKARLQRTLSAAPRPRSLGSFGSEPPRSRAMSAPLRPPRPVNITESDDGYVKIDSSSYRLLCQDLNSVKTMLHRLKSIIYDAETLNPFDQVGSKNVFYQSMAHCDLPPGCPLPSPHLEEHKTDMVFVQQENADLRRQLVLLQQQLEDKDHTIRLLQQQMMKYANIQDEEEKSTLCNSATQTDRLPLNCATSLTEELLPTSPSSTLVSFNLTLSSPNCTENRALSKDPELPMAVQMAAISHIPSIFVDRDERDPIVHNSVYL